MSVTQLFKIALNLEMSIILTIREKKNILKNAKHKNIFYLKVRN